MRRRLQDKKLTGWEDTPRQRSKEPFSVLKSMVDVVPDAALAIHPEGQFAAYNQRFAELWGIPVETADRSDELSTLLGLFAQVIDKADLLAALGDYAHPAGVPSREEVRLRDGRVLERYVVPATDGVARSLGHIYVLRDVTARRRLDEALSESRSALAQVEALAHIGSWSFDLKSRRLAWSAETYRIYGVDPAVFVPSYEAFFTRVHPEDCARVEHVYLKSVEDRTSFECEHRIVMDDGSIRSVREQGQTFYDADGNPQHSVGTVLDITGQRAAEAALRESEEKYRNLVETSSDFIWETDANERFTYANPVVEAMLGYAPSQLSGKSPFDLMPADDAARVEKEIRPLVAARKSFPPFESTLLRKTGGKIVVETSATPIFDKHGTFVGYRGITRDITQRVQTEQVLRETLQRAHNQLALTSLMSQSDALLSGDVEHLARIVTEHGAEVMGCERVNVWLFDETETELTCIDLFEATPKRHSSGAVLHEREYGSEFRTIKADKYVDANDPLTDPRTAGYVETYLKPLGITSMLDVAIQAPGRTFGLICFEHVGKPHVWEKDEIAFANQLADKIALAITTRRRIDAEEALRSGERQLSNALAIARAGGWEYNAVKNLFTFNDNFYRIFGTTAEEVGGYTMSPDEYARRFVHPDDLAIVGKEVAAALSTRDPHYSREIEHRFLYANGQTGCMAVRFFVIKDAQGHTIKSYGVNQDITARKRLENELVLSNVLRATTMETSLDGILVIDDRGKVITHNRNFERMFGIPQELIDSGDDATMLAHAAGVVNDKEGFLAKVKYYYEHRGEAGHDEIELKDGRIFDRDTACLYDKGNYLGRAWFFRDITERKRAEVSLMESRNLIEAILNAVPVRIFWKDRHLVYLGCNSAFAGDAGFSDPAEVMGKDDFEMAWKDQADLYRLDDLQVIDSGRDKLLIEEPQTTADGKTVVLLTSKVPLRNSNGDIIGVLGTYQDITDRKQAQATILKMARVDALTGLANRNVFVEELDRAIAQAHRGHNGFAVLYLDLDHFKDVNDTLGHPVGDDLLKAVADRIRHTVREVDTVARFGGDEFAVIMTELSDPTEAAVLADKLLKHLAEPYHLDGNQILSGTSIGIATFGPDTPDAETLLTQADVALYRAKAEGRSTFRFFTEAMDHEVKVRVALGTELREAIASEQFSLFYQPEVEIETGRILGVEALVRWRHPRRGLIGPAEFIPAAEKSGLIIALGRWVVREACRQTRAWIDLGVAPDFVAVNLSILQFKSTQDLEKDIAEALAEFSVPPRTLELELTETVLMDASRRNSDILQRLRNQGVRIAIDDFGTGYSSLEYLRRLTVDRLKIAQAFVTDLDGEASSGVIVRAALGLARELGLGVVAEGVENQEQLELLRAWGCHEVQGFYFSEPKPAEEITTLLQEGRISVTADRLAASPSHRLRPKPAAKIRAGSSTPDLS